MKYLLDSDTIIYYLNGDRNLADKIAKVPSGQLCTSTIKSPILPSMVPSACFSSACFCFSLAFHDVQFGTSHTNHASACTVSAFLGCPTAFRRSHSF